MEKRLKRLAESNGLKIGAARVNGDSHFFIKTQDGNVLNDGFSFSERDALEYLQKVEEFQGEFAATRPNTCPCCGQRL